MKKRLEIAVSSPVWLKQSVTGAREGMFCGMMRANVRQESKGKIVRGAEYHAGNLDVILNKSDM